MKASGSKRKQSADGLCTANRLALPSPRYLVVPCLGLPRGLGRARQPQMACLGLPRVLGEISEKIPNQVFSNSRKYFVTNIFGGHDDLTQCRCMSVRPSVHPSVRPSVHLSVRPPDRRRRQAGRIIFKVANNSTSLFSEKQLI